jgi:hypothetical protein
VRESPGPLLTSVFHETCSRPMDSHEQRISHATVDLSSKSKKICVAPCVTDVLSDWTEKSSLVQREERHPKTRPDEDERTRKSSWKYNQICLFL